MSQRAVDIAVREFKKTGVVTAVNGAAAKSFALGAEFSVFLDLPTACAVGCILSPLRGWSRTFA
jgi:hypothetical protein